MALVTAGFGGSTWLVRARVGDVVGGLAASVSSLATFFLLFGLSAVCIPGSLGFISGELLLGALFSRGMFQGFILLAASALTGIAVYYQFTQTFQGPPRLSVSGIGLLFRERMGFLVLLISLAVPCMVAWPTYEGSRSRQLSAATPEAPKG